MVEALWIIFVIIAVVMKFFNKIDEVKTKLPEDWSEEKLPPVLRDWGFPWDDPELEEMRQEQAAQKRAETAGGTGFREEAGEAAEKPVLAPVRPSQDEKHGEHPLLTGDNLINGIILSELLQPPKAKRHTLRSRY